MSAHETRSGYGVTGEPSTGVFAEFGGSPLETPGRGSLRYPRDLSHADQKLLRLIREGVQPPVADAEALFRLEKKRLIYSWIEGGPYRITVFGALTLRFLTTGGEFFDGIPHAKKEPEAEEETKEEELRGSAKVSTQAS